MPTRRASLTGVGGVHSDHLATGAFSLVREDSAKHPPTCVGNGLGKAVVLHHARYIQIFDGNPPETVDKPAGGLVDKIVTAVSDALVNTADNPTRFSQGGFLLLFAAGFETFHLALRFRQSRFVLAEKARVGDKLAVTGGGKVFQPNINADLLCA